MMTITIQRVLVSSVLTLTLSLSCEAVPPDPPNAITDVCGDYDFNKSSVAKDLKILSLFSLNKDSEIEKLLRSVHLAMQLVNEKKIIPGYNLYASCYVTMGDVSEVLYNMLTAIKQSADAFIMIVGPSAAHELKHTAKVSQHYNLVQVGYTSAYFGMTYKSEFPRFARVGNSLKRINLAYVRLLQFYNWKRVCIISQMVGPFTGMVSNLRKQIKNAGIDVPLTQVYIDDPTSYLQNMEEKDCRIILAQISTDPATFLCTALRLRMIGPKRVWLLPHLLDAGWWFDPDLNVGNDSTCSRSQLSQAVEGLFFVRTRSVVEANREDIVNEWSPNERAESSVAKINSEFALAPKQDQRICTEAFDTVWAVAFALAKASKQLQTETSGRAGGPKRLEDFTYKDQDMAKTLYESLLNVSFQGVGGVVAFDALGNLNTPLDVCRVQESDTVVIGRFGRFGENETIDDAIFKESETFGNAGYFERYDTLNMYTHLVKWADGVIPADSKTRKAKLVPTTVYAVFTAFAFLGIVQACLFLLFNFLLRHRKLVKRSSPNINAVILLGCILSFASVTFLKNGQNGLFGCKLKISLIIMGFSLSYGALCVKTWRIYVIFSKPRAAKSKRLSDRRLLGFLLLLAVITVVVMMIWFHLDPKKLKETPYSGAPDPDCPEEDCIQYQVFCISASNGVGLTFVFAPHCFLLVSGTYMAYQTRGVHIKEMNDSSLIGMATYTSVITCLTYALFDSVVVDPVYNYASLSLIALFGTFSTQCIIFLPKVHQWCTQKDGVMDARDSTNTLVSAHGENKSQISLDRPSVNVGGVKSRSTSSTTKTQEEPLQSLTTNDQRAERGGE